MIKTLMQHLELLYGAIAGIGGTKILDYFLKRKKGTVGEYQDLLDRHKQRIDELEKENKEIWKKVLDMHQEIIELRAELTFIRGYGSKREVG